MTRCLSFKNAQSILPIFFEVVAAVFLMFVASGCTPRAEPSAEPSPETREKLAVPQEEPASTEDRAANFAAAPAAESNELVAGPWHSWRGPNGNGVVIDQNPPAEWSDSGNIVWRSKVPGRGHASPIVVGDQVILATSDKADETQSVVSFDIESGEQRWSTVINTGGFPGRIYPTNTHASSSVVSDGEMLFAVFNNNGLAQVAALDLEGKVTWEKEAAVFVPKRYKFGFGASPIVYGDTVIVTSECEQEGSMVAFNKKSGDEVWRVARENATSYSTPVVADVGGKQQLVLSGGKEVVSYDPTNGKELWRIDGPWGVTCGTAVWSDDLVFVSGGFPTARTVAIKGDGSGEIVWENQAKFYEQSMLFHDGYVYGLADSGVAYCWRAADGQEMWKERMENKVSASPVLAGGNIYISVENGKTYVFKPNPGELELVATNQLGDTAYATPTFVGNQIFIRVADGADKAKQEWLYCIGSE